MDNRIWMNHLRHWQDFLNIRYTQVNDNGEKAKITRQLRAIEDAKYAAVLNPELMIEFIRPTRDPVSINQEIEYVLNLNDSQKHAVSIALGDNVLSLIQGPPGTGKTQVIAEICLQLYQKNPDIHILVCSETHIAVNNLISRIAEYNDTIRIARIRDKEHDIVSDMYSPESIVKAYSNWLCENLENLELAELIIDSLAKPENKSLEKALAQSASITGMTCNRLGAYNLDTESELFDVVIIDEVCKATLPEILIPLAVAKKAILVGDPKQLPPVFCSEEVDVIRSIDRCSLQNYMYIDHLFESSKCVTVLDTQYRMSQQIGSMVSDLFYNKQLMNGSLVHNKGQMIWYDYSPSNEWPIMLQEDEFLQIYNLDECQIVVDVLQEIDSGLNNHQTVAIIAPYRSQVSRLRKILQDMDFQFIMPRVDTVDGFQGRECDVVVFTLTRTHGSYRFLADSRRMNVALSRAKHSLYVIGSLAYAKTNSLLSAVSEYCEIREIKVSVKSNSV